MDRVVELANHFEIHPSICINKFDVNPDMTVAIEEYGTDRALPIVGRIPFDPSFTMAMVPKQAIIEYDGNCSTAHAVKEIWERVRSSL